MASPRTRRVLKDLKIKDDNNVCNYSPKLIMSSIFVGLTISYMYVYLEEIAHLVVAV